MSIHLLCELVYMLLYSDVFNFLMTQVAPMDPCGGWIVKSTSARSSFPPPRVRLLLEHIYIYIPIITFIFSPSLVPRSIFFLLLFTPQQLPFTFFKFLISFFPLDLAIAPLDPNSYSRWSPVNRFVFASQTSLHV